MSTPVMTSPKAAAASRRPAPPRRERLNGWQRILVGLELVMGLPGLAGGIYMSTHAATIMSLSYLEHTPFADWTLPGVCLAVFVGGGGVAAATAQLLRMPVAEYGHYAAGLGMIMWIVVEAAWVVWFPVLQIPYTALGMVITLCAVANSARLHGAGIDARA